MTTTNAISRQPTQLDYASPTQFKFSITKLPKVEYFCTEVNIPSLQISNATQVTSLRDIPLPGTKLDFGDLSLTYMVDEKFENFEEIYGWVRGLGFPVDHKDYSNLLAAGRDRFPNQGKNNVNRNAGREGTAQPQGAILSDATLSMMSSEFTPEIQLSFEDSEVLIIQSSYDLKNWTDMDSQTSPHIEGIEDKKFFRLKVVD